MITISYLYGKLFQKFLQGKRVIGSTIHKTSTVCAGSTIIDSSFGKYSYTGYNCVVVNTEVVNFCSLANDIYIGGAEHPVNWVSTSPAFQNIKHSEPKRRFAKNNVEELKKTYIGNDVWVGNKVIVKAGIRIGTGSVIGAGAVVTNDIPPYAIVGGVPARIIKYRFSKEIIDALLKSEWWNLDEHYLNKIGGNINNPVEFLIALNSIK